MKQYFLFAFMAFTLAVNSTSAQLISDDHDHRKCHSMEVLEQQLADDPSLQSRMEAIERHTAQYVTEHANEQGGRLVYTIPVVFHVVYNTAIENVSDAQIMSQLEVMNEDFRRTNSDANLVPADFVGVAADAEINFCLAQRDPNGAATTGINRRQFNRANWGVSTDVKNAATGGIDPWDPDMYLNVWVCNIGGGILGYAQFPGGFGASDGVVCTYTAFGTIGTATPPFHLGRTMTHEIGHYLGLRHIWGDANCGDDLVSDTPLHTSQNYGCPSYPSIAACTGNPVMMTMNYMDYTNDACMYMFSAGQKTRMSSYLAMGGSRHDLTTSLGCQPPAAGNCGPPTGLVATNITETAAILSWGAVAGAASYNLEYKTNAAGTWTTVSVVGTSYNLTGLTNSTLYNARVAAVCNNVAGANSSQVNFTTLSPNACVDNYEANESLAAAASIATNTNINASIYAANDFDYFTFTTNAVGTININLSNLPNDYDLKLYNGAQTEIGVSQNIGNANETITFPNAAAGTYYIFVYGYNNVFDASTCYLLTADFSPNCDPPTNLTVNNITTSSAIVGWSAVQGATSYSLQYKTNAAVNWNTVTTSNLSYTLSNLSPSTIYNYRVASVCSGLTGSYSSQANFTTLNQPCNDLYESNQSIRQAKAIPVASNVIAQIPTTSDRDFFRFFNTNSQRNILIQLTNLPADFDVKLYSSNGTLLGQSLNRGNSSETIIFNTTTVGTYFIQVHGYNGALSANSCYTLRAEISSNPYRFEAEEEGTLVFEEGHKLEDMLTLFPNPTYGSVTLRFNVQDDANVQILVSDLLGRAIYNQMNTVEIGMQELNLDLSQFPNGFYFVTVRNSNMNETRRLSIER